MKTKIILCQFILVLLVIFVGCGSNESDGQSTMMNTTEVCEEPAEESNEENNLLRRKELNLYDGTLNYIRRFEYDEDGRIIKETINYSNTLTNVVTDVVIEFSYTNDLLERILCYQDGIVVYEDKQDGEYGMLDCEFYVEDYMLAFVYYKNGKLYSERIIGPTGGWIYSNDYLYDAQGNLVNYDMCYMNEKSPSYAEAVWTLREYVYDTYGNRIAMCFRQENSGDDGYYEAGLINFLTSKYLGVGAAHFDGNDNVIGFTLYEYDNKGNINKEIYYDVAYNEIGNLEYFYSD